MLLTLTLITILVSISAVSAADSYVNGSIVAPGDGSSWDQAVKNITAGYNVVTDGFTINIAAGTYTGNENKNIVVDKTITIQGAGSNKTTIDCEGSGYAFYIPDFRNVTFKDLTIQNGNASDSGGAICGNGNLNISDCTFINNTARRYGGAVANAFQNTTITNCVFTGNTASWGGAVTTCGPSTVSGCIFNGNTADFGGAFFIYSGICDITGCNFYDNKANVQGAAIYGNYTYNPDFTNSATTIKYSRFMNNTVGTTPQDLYLYNPVQVEIPNTMNATLNWWGSNSGPTAERVAHEGNVPIVYNPWLQLNIYADPSTIYTGETSKITANVYMDFAGFDHSADAAQFFSGPVVTFTTNLGNVGSKQVTVPWSLGSSSVTLRGDEGAGIATVAATDGQIVSTDVTILQTSEVNAASVTSTGTVGMQNTGAPLTGIVLTLLMVVGGFLGTRKKQ